MISIFGCGRGWDLLLPSPGSKLIKRCGRGAAEKITTTLWCPILPFMGEATIKCQYSENGNETFVHRSHFFVVSIIVEYRALYDD